MVDEVGSMLFSRRVGMRGRYVCVNDSILWLVANYMNVHAITPSHPNISYHYFVASRDVTVVKCEPNLSNDQKRSLQCLLIMSNSRLRMKFYLNSRFSSKCCSRHCKIFKGFFGPNWCYRCNWSR